MYLKLDGKGAVYAQLARALKRAIMLGHLKPGSSLPATRVLAADRGLSRNTVNTAYEILCTEQLAVTRPGAGTFVAELAARTLEPVAPPTGAPSPPQSHYAARMRRLPPFALRRRDHSLRYDLQCGEPLTDLGLITTWRRELARAALECDGLYPPSQGLPALRGAVADYLARKRGLPCDADDIVIVNGAQQAVALLARVLLDPGDTVAVEEPGYQLATYAFKAHGAKVLHLPTDAEGLVVQALPRGGVRLVHVTPSHQFPSGGVMSLPRRLQLLDYAARQDCWIIEDDYDGEFRFDGGATPVLASLDTQQRVIYVGSFSKVLFPGLRMGYAVCPRGLRRDMVFAKVLDDVACGSIEQAALASLMRNGGFDRHLRRTALELRRRRATLLAGLQRHCGAHITVRDDGAGMHLAGWLPGWTAEAVDALVACAHARGLGLQPIGPHFHRQPGPAGLILGFASLSTKQLRSATQLLGDCLSECFSDCRAEVAPAGG